MASSASRHDAVHEADALGLGRADLARREEQVERVRGTDHARQQPREAPLGDEPAARERGGEDRATRAAKRTSQQSAIGTAMPAQAPLIAATTGLRIDIR